MVGLDTELPKEHQPADMKTHASLALIVAVLLAMNIPISQAKNARYYKWQGADRVVCAQTSPGKGWTRLHGSFVKSDCSI